MSENDQLRTDINSGLLQKNNELVRLESSHRSAMDSMESQCNLEREELNRRNWAEVDRLHGQHRNALKQMQETNSHHITQIKLQHEAHINRIKSQYGEENRLQEVVSRFNSSAEQLENLAIKLDNQVDSYRQCQLRETTAKEGRIDDACNSLKTEIAAAVEYKKNLEQLTKEFRLQISDHKELQLIHEKKWVAKLRFCSFQTLGRCQIDRKRTKIKGGSRKFEICGNPTT